jgi:hypothetical protein
MVAYVKHLSFCEINKYPLLRHIVDVDTVETFIALTHSKSNCRNNDLNVPSGPVILCLLPFILAQLGMVMPAIAGFQSELSSSTSA